MAQFTKWLLAAAIASICFILASSILTDSSLEEEVRTSALPMGIGGGDDKDGREDFDRRRFADPKTGEIPENINRLAVNFMEGQSQNRSKTADEQFYLHGPTNVGGRTRAVAFDVNNPNRVLAGGVTGGMFVSTDGGQSYKKTTGPNQLHSVTSVVQDRREGKTNIWYYGTGEYYGVISNASFSNRSSGDGIYVSINGGNNWSPLSNTLSNTPNTWASETFDIIWRLVLDHTELDKNVILAAVYGGIIRSEDGGSSWEPVLGFSGSCHYTDIMITEEGVMYASLNGGVDRGFWRSEDGLQWTDITPDDLLTSVRRTVMAYAPSNENMVYFLTETPAAPTTGHSMWKYTFLSGDGSGDGGLWDNRSENLPSCDCSGFYTFEFCTYSSQNSYNMFLRVHPEDPDVLFLGGTNIYRTTDGFTSPEYAWIGGYYCDEDSSSNYVYPQHHPDQHELLFFPGESNKVLSASDGGLAISHDIMADEVTWEQASQGYVTTQFYTLAIEGGESTSDNLVGGTQDNGTWWTNTRYENEAWKWVLYGDGAFAAITQGAEHYYLSWQSGKVFKCKVTEGGELTHMRRIDPPGASDHGFINPLILDPADENVMYIPAGRYIWVNSNLSEIEDGWEEYESTSQNWSKINESDIGLSLDNSITALAKHKDNDRLYYGDSRGRLYMLEGALTEEPVRTTLTDSAFPNNAYINCISIDELNADDILVVFSNYGIRSLFHSIDGGSSWTDVSGNLEEEEDGSGAGPSTIWAAVRNTAEGTKQYYVGTSVGLYMAESLEGDATQWTQSGADIIGNVPIAMIVTRAFDDRMVVATHGNGVYQMGTAPEPVSLQQLANGLELKCYPNPFQIQTNIQFSLAKDARVALNIYDNLGSKVWESPSQYYKSGVHNTIWNGRNLQGVALKSGLYHIEVVGKKWRKTTSVVKQ